MTDGARKKYTLKNGAEMEAGAGLAALNSLRALLAQRPHLFRALRAIVQGRPEDATPEQVALLKRYGYLNATSGEVCSDLPDVLLCAYQETPEGPVLVNPFQFTHADEARAVEQAENDGLDWLARELRKDDGKGRPPSRG